MHSDSQDETTTPELVAEMRAIVDETRRAIAASQAILDRCAEHRAPLLEPEAPDLELDGQEFLGEITDGLLHAYGFAKREGDGQTVALIEKALFHVGRRLARGLSVAEAGLVCH